MTTMLKKVIFLLLFLPARLMALHPDTLPAQNTTPACYLKSFLYDGISVVTLPLHWQARDWASVAFAFTGGGMVMAHDDKIFTQFQNARGPLTNHAAKYIFGPLGSGLASLPALALVYSYGKYYGHSRPAEMAMQGFKAFLLAGFFSGGAKIFFHRHRPSETNDAWVFDGPSVSTRNLSFPSGHTTTAFAIATVAAHYYPDRPWIGILAYSGAVMAGLSRINDGVHWPSDVFFGAALGYAVGRTIARNAGRAGNKKTMCMPFTGLAGSGISLVYRF